MGRYIDPDTGVAFEMDDATASTLGWQPESATAAADRAIAAQRAEDYGGVAGAAEALRLGAVRGLTGGASDVALRTVAPDMADDAAQYRAVNPVTSAGAELGAMLMGGPRSMPGAFAKAGAAAGRTTAEASLGAKLLGGAASAGTETALYNVGQVASDAALADDPVTLDHIGGAIKSGYLLGGVIGGPLGGLEHQLAAKGRALKAARLEAEQAPAVAQDLAGLDAKALREARDAELAAIEATRVPQRAQLADEIRAFREAQKVERPWDAVATGSKDALRESGKTAKDAVTAAARAEAAATRAAEQAARVGTVGPGLPAYDAIGDKALRRTVPARSLAGRVRALPGAGEDAVRLDKARAAIADGQKQPIKLVARADGSLEVVDGRHRLLAAMEADAPIKLQLERGAAGAADDGAVLLGDGYARIVADEIKAKTTRLTDEAVRLRAAADEATQAYETAVAASKSAHPRWMREEGLVSLKSDRSIDNLLNDPKALSGVAGEGAFRSSALAAQKALRVQEYALQGILDHADELKVIHALDGTGRRAAALQSVAPALERNRALQRQIDALVAAPASPRLNEIADAAASIGKAPPMTLKQKVGGALAFGAVTAAAGGLDLPGVNYIAPVLGAAAGSAVAAKLGGTLARATAASLARQAKAVEALMTGARVVRRVTPPLASKVLAAARFAPVDAKAPAAKAATLTDHYHARAAELARAVQPGPDGKPRVRPEVRRAIADRLAPIAHTAPILADKLQTAAVRRVEYIAAKMPRPTVIGMTTIPPPEAAIRAWARVIAAADDPGGIEERVAAGNVTPEDRDVMRALYPDRMAAMVAQIVTHPEQFAKLPYVRRLALAVFTGAPIEASLDPRILAALQGIYAREPGTEGGTQAPRPQPAFGSVKAPEATPAERRAG